MSDIVIRDMEMPKSCLDEKSVNDCPIVGICQIYKNTPYPEKRDKFFEQRLEGCPLVELKPHGRLIDADELEEHYNALYNALESDDRIYTEEAWETAEAIAHAPTILEASK